MSAIILYWLTSLFIRKNNKALKSEIKTTHKKLVASFKYFNLKIILRNNFDIKPAVLKLFFSAFIIDLLLISLTAFANIFYFSSYIYNFFKIQIPDVGNQNLPWIGSLIINLLFIIFIIRVTSAYYKLSLRGNYRHNYLKLLWIDILTFNIFNVIGSLIFAKTKFQMLQINYDDKINDRSLTSESVKNYLKLIVKIEISLFMINLMILLISLILGYYVNNNSIKIICWAIIVWNMIIFSSLIPQLIGMLITQKMFQNLLTNNYGYYYLLITIRFLVFVFGYYYFSVFLNVLNLDQDFKTWILENL